jgi:hypothetical protein
MENELNEGRLSELSETPAKLAWEALYVNSFCSKHPASLKPVTLQWQVTSKRWLTNIGKEAPGHFPWQRRNFKTITGSRHWDRIWTPPNIKGWGWPPCSVVIWLMCTSLFLFLDYRTIWPFHLVQPHPLLSPHASFPSFISLPPSPLSSRCFLQTQTY